MTMSSPWLLAALVVVIAYGIVCYIAGRLHSNADVSAWRDTTQRTHAILPKPIPGREQFLRDLRGEGAKRDGLWRSRRRRDNEARNRRRA